MFHDWTRFLRNIMTYVHRQNRKLWNIRVTEAPKWVLMFLGQTRSPRNITTYIVHVYD
jgi:hypothetical protein